MAEGFLHLFDRHEPNTEAAGILLPEIIGRYQYLFEPYATRFRYALLDTAHGTYWLPKGTLRT